MDTKLHVGRNGTPMKCVAEDGKCPLAPGIAHFEKAEQAEAFADRLNELEVEGYTYKGKVEDVKNLSDAELVYIQKDIKSKAKENDNYSAYKSQIKWQKEVRTKTMKRLKEINDENNEILAREAKMIDMVAKNRKAYQKEKDEEKRLSAYLKYQNSLQALNVEHARNSLITKANQAEFAKLADKKDSAEQKIIPLMEKRSEHNGIKRLEANVNAEIDKRDINKPLPKIYNNVYNVQDKQNSLYRYKERGEFDVEKKFARAFQNIHKDRVSSVDFRYFKQDYRDAVEATATYGQDGEKHTDTIEMYSWDGEYIIEGQNEGHPELESVANDFNEFRQSKKKK